MDRVQLSETTATAGMVQYHTTLTIQTYNYFLEYPESIESNWIHQI